MAQGLWEEGVGREWDVDVLEGLRVLARGARRPMVKGGVRKEKEQEQEQEANETGEEEEEEEEI